MNSSHVPEFSHGNDNVRGNYEIKRLRGRSSVNRCERSDRRSKPLH